MTETLAPVRDGSCTLTTEQVGLALNTALNLLRTRGWVKHNYANDLGFCAIGALNESVYVTLVDYRVDAEDAAAVVAEHHLIPLIADMYPDCAARRERLFQPMTVEAFNDDPETTLDMVEALFEKAIVKVGEL